VGSPACQINEKPNLWVVMHDRRSEGRFPTAKTGPQI
jgi:hypothetical protein